MNKNKLIKAFLKLRAGKWEGTDRKLLKIFNASAEFEVSGKAPAYQIKPTNNAIPPLSIILYKKNKDNANPSALKTVQDFLEKYDAATNQL